MDAPPLAEGDRLTVHEWSCLPTTSADQHACNVIGGTVREVVASHSRRYPGVVAWYYVVELDSREWVQLNAERIPGPGWADWSDEGCPAARRHAEPVRAAS